jgi:hypothetical protein
MSHEAETVSASFVLCPILFPIEMTMFQTENASAAWILEEKQKMCCQGTADLAWT